MEQLRGPPPPATLTHARAATTPRREARHTPRPAGRAGAAGLAGRAGPNQARRRPPRRGLLCALGWAGGRSSRHGEDGGGQGASPSLGLPGRPWKRTRHRAEPKYQRGPAPTRRSGPASGRPPGTAAPRAPLLWRGEPVEASEGILGSCKTLLHGPGPRATPFPIFPPLPPEVKLGSLESERNAHCHSQIHGTKPWEPGWKPRQKQLRRRRRRRAYSLLYKLPIAPVEGSQPTSSPGKEGGKWLLMA